MRKLWQELLKEALYLINLICVIGIMGEVSLNLVVKVTFNQL